MCTSMCVQRELKMNAAFAKCMLRVKNIHYHHHHPQPQTIRFYCLWSMRFSYLADISSSVLATLTSFCANGFDAITTTTTTTISLVHFLSHSFSPLILLLKITFLSCPAHNRFSLMSVLPPPPSAVRTVENMCANPLRIVYNCNQYMSFHVCCVWV